ncbi:hypothetical protein FHG87_016299, partial [Trinorchestia longiramus]
LLAKQGLPRMPLHLYEFYNGTVSTAIVRVPCNTSLSQSDCDAVVDRLNRERRKQSALALALEPQHGSLWSAGHVGLAEDTTLTIKECKHPSTPPHPPSPLRPLIFRIKGGQRTSAVPVCFCSLTTQLNV